MTKPGGDGKKSLREKVGEVRPSQLLHSYGVGALADLPGLSVMILGLESWHKDDCALVQEPRLLQAVKYELNQEPRELRLAPAGEDDPRPFAQATGGLKGVPVQVFPTWLRCMACNRLLQAGGSELKLKPNSFRPEQVLYQHVNCLKSKNFKAVPVRFMIACKSGHLSDFPWVAFVHNGNTCGSPILRISDASASGDATQILVSCENCGLNRRLADAMGERGKANLPQCPGEHPHLRAHEPVECEEQAQLIALGSSNLWFPASKSALSIPDALFGLPELVHQQWDDLKKIRSEEGLEVALDLLGKHAKIIELLTYPLAEILALIKEKQVSGWNDESDTSDIKGPEYAVLASGKARSDKDFQIRYVAAPLGHGGLIERVGLVERLREVRALTGFSRIEPADEQDTGQAEQNRKRRVSLTAGPTNWVPVYEVRGEGIFIQFKTESLDKWAEQPEVQVREQKLIDAHIQWRRDRDLPHPDANFPGIRYVLLHSFSHALMRQFALECGYSAASIRERIYAREAEGDRPAMAGILLYTSAPDSEGTLGGLVALGRPDILGMHIDEALEGVQTCAADPLCSEHDPITDASLHAAACHACLFSSETSCERGNRYLDRVLLFQEGLLADF